MKKKRKNVTDYDLFGSVLRGTEEVETMVKTIIQGKQTPENLSKLAKAVSIEWNQTDNNVLRLKLAFSRFEEKLEKNKHDILAYYAREKENQKDSTN